MFSFVMLSKSSSFVPDHNGSFVTGIKEQHPVNQDDQMEGLFNNKGFEGIHIICIFLMSQKHLNIFYYASLRNCS